MLRSGVPAATGGKSTHSNHFSDASTCGVPHEEEARRALDFFKGAYRGPYTEVRAAKSRALEKGAVGPACQSPFGGSWAVYGTVLIGELCMQLYGYKPAALRKAFSLTLKREVWEALQAVLKRVLARPGGRIARALHQTT